MEHPEFINYLIQQHGYKRYLEIGASDGQCLAKIQCELIHGVDPSPYTKGNFVMTSDHFFSILDPAFKYDIIFIDGMHLEEYVDRDVENALKHLSPGGIIMMHDCNPPTAWHQRSWDKVFTQPGDWNGTGWRSLVKLRMRDDLQVETIDADWGCGIVRPGKQIPITIPNNFTYDDLVTNRQSWLGLISIAHFISKYSRVASQLTTLPGQNN